MSKEFERFISKVKKTKTCWLWQGAINSAGYGAFWYEKKSGYAHVFSAQYYLGKNNKWVLHHCDVKECVNPEHLYYGDRFDNAQDASRRGRMATFEKHGLGKLTKRDCFRIRFLREHGFSARAIGRMYEIHNWTALKAAKRADALLLALEAKHDK